MDTLTLTLEQTEKALDRAFKADVPILLEGEPGTGKTETVGRFARQCAIPLHPLLLSQCDPSDVGGIPYRDPATGQILRLPIGPIKACVDHPGVLFLDEFDKCAPAIRGASLGLVNERRAGDFALHTLTRIVLGANPSDVGDGSNDVGAASWNRVTRISVCPSLLEVQAYVSALGQPGSALRLLGADYAATLEVSPGLLQVRRPAGSEGTWASPRAIVKGLQLAGACAEAGDDLDRDPVVRALFAGIVGETVGGAWWAIRAIRHKLPSRAEILANPDTAKLPDGLDAGIAALGVIAQVGIEDPCAAWIYADRLTPETRAASGRYLGHRGAPIKPGAKRATEAQRARAKILGASGATMGRASV